MLRMTGERVFCQNKRQMVLFIYLELLFLLLLFYNKKVKNKNVKF